MIRIINFFNHHNHLFSARNFSFMVTSLWLLSRPLISAIYIKKFHSFSYTTVAAYWAFLMSHFLFERLPLGKKFSRELIFANFFFGRLRKLIFANFFFGHFAGINFREFGFTEDFAGINFRELILTKDFAGINFRECALYKDFVGVNFAFSLKNIFWRH